MDENMLEGHERKGRNARRKREKGRDFWSTQCFLPASKQNPRTPIGAVARPTRVREKYVEDPEENHEKRHTRGEGGGRRAFRPVVLKGFNVMRDSLTP